MNPTLKKVLPHIIAFVILLGFSFTRFAPVVFEGKTLQQFDIIQFEGMFSEIKEYKQETGEAPLWTNSAFAGMPAYQISYPQTSLMKPVFKTALLGNPMRPPHTGILLMCMGMYLLLIVLRVDWRLSIVGALAFGLAANHMGLAAAGHATKIVASAYMAPILAGLILTFRGKYWLGAGMIALFTGLQIFANHVQITYYFFLTLFIFGIVQLVKAAKTGAWAHFIKASLFSVLAVGLAAGTNAGRLMCTQEYAEETIRGESELTQKSSQFGSKAGEDGLSKEYAFGWSYGMLETFNLLIPNFMGGNGESFVNEPGSASLSAIRNIGGEELTQYAQAKGMDPSDQNAVVNSMAQEVSHYWGPQPFTDGGVYFGAVVLLLFFMGAFLVKDPVKWYIIAGMALTIMLAWGKNFAPFNFFLFDNLPLFNKFRAVTMSLNITNMLVVVLAFLGLQSFFDKNISTEEKRKALIMGGGVALGLVLLGFLLSYTMDFEKVSYVVQENDEVVAVHSKLPASVASAVAEDRAGLLRADAFRTLAFILLAFGLLWVWMKNRFSAVLAVVGLGLLVVVDQWSVGNRFLDESKYLDQTRLNQFKAPSPANEQINQDKDPHFRVADFSRGNPFSNAITSLHHHSMGGYHAAKLMRYQELIDRYLSNPQNDKIYGMLNCKYFIGQNNQVFPNREALGNAWFVKNILDAPNGDAEIAALATIDPAETVVIQEDYMGDLKGFSPQFDSTASIKLTSYSPDEMVYSYSAKTDQLAVFSEVYYPPSKGWEMWIDGEQAPDFAKGNFLLRVAKLPAGQHEVKMVFNPQTYKKGEMISLISSILVILLAGFGIFWFTKNYDVPEWDSLPEAEKNEKAPVKKTKPKRKKK